MGRDWEGMEGREMGMHENSCHMGFGNTLSRKLFQEQHIMSQIVRLCLEWLRSYKAFKQL